MHLRIDNDSFAHIDRWYSHRHELGITSAIKRVDPNASEHLLSWQLRLGQAMWTPRNIQFVEPPERDLHFAGYLYGDLGVLLRWTHHTLQVRARLGVIGPAAKAGPTQEAIHRVLGVRQPRGWGNQLPNQAAGHATATYAFHRSWNVDGLRFGGAVLVRADLGNLAQRIRIATTLGAAYGITARAFAEVSEPTLSSGRCKSACVALFVSGEATAVWHDLVVEASGATDPPDIERRNGIGTLRFGFLVGGPRAWMRYVHHRQTRLFSTSPRVPRNHRWGVFELGIPFG